MAFSIGNLIASQIRRFPPPAKHVEKTFHNIPGDNSLRTTDPARHSPKRACGKSRWRQCSVLITRTLNLEFFGRFTTSRPRIRSPFYIAPGAIFTSSPFTSGFISFPLRSLILSKFFVSPPSMWSNDRFSIIKTTTCLRFSKPFDTGLLALQKECFRSRRNLAPHVTVYRISQWS